MSSTFEKAKQFMYRNARPLDLARFQYHFENGSKEAVINALSYYQNTDGGFGHAVEADCWNPNSIPLHSDTACGIIREIDFEDAEHPVIRKLLKWYESGECFNGKTWAVAVPSTNNYPHAFWWHSDNDSNCYDNYNCTAQSVGFIVRYAKPNSKLFDLGIRIANEAIEAFSQKKITDAHTCACYISMKDYIEKAGATDLIHYDSLKNILHESVNELIVSDSLRWGEYVCKPSQFLSSKNSEYYSDNKEISDYECDYIINSQLADGSWDISWSWNDFPDEWAISKNWWKGHGIILNLLYLKGFEKLF